MYLQQSSKIYFFKTHKVSIKKSHPYYYVKLMINNNLAQYGGGIFVADDTERSVCGGGATQTIHDECFIQTFRLYHSKSADIFNTFMTNNMATQSGADIYGGLLDRCIASKNVKYIGLNYIKKTVKSSTELSISSMPVRVTVHSNDYTISTRKGHTFKISVMAVDQVGNPVNATIRSSVVSESGVGRLKEGQANREVGNQCTELEYNVFSQDSSAQVEFYAEGPCTNLGISRQLNY